MGTSNLIFHSPPETLVEFKPTKLVQHINVPIGESSFYLAFPEADENPYTIHFHLHHPESQVLIRGIVRSYGNEKPDLTTVIHHHSSHTRGETLIRTLAYDASQPHYQGLISIDPDIANIESYLNHHSLLLGAEAKSWTIPSLEIRSNQVKCSHAATIRNIKEADLFYARSRGLSQDSAKHIMIEAFLTDVKRA